jgi:pyruvate/2-oxoglutarate/acetoin dehydrogenase E1 component
VRIAEEAAERLATAGVSLEVIDVRTLLPFDRPQLIAQSIKKTNAVIFMDEDVPGGATAFMMQQVFEQHGAYHDLDAPPKTLTAPANRPAYASDADYWCKPSVEDLVEAAMTIMHERHPEVYQL